MSDRILARPSAVGVDLLCAEAIPWRAKRSRFAMSDRILARPSAVGVDLLCAEAIPWRAKRSRFAMSDPSLGLRGRSGSC